MAMTAGTVTIADDGTETIGADLAGAWYASLKASGVLTLATFGQTIPAGAAGAAVKRGWASLANALAAGLVPYLQANAQAVIGTSLGGLQVSTAVGATTNPPTSIKTIPIT